MAAERNDHKLGISNSITFFVGWRLGPARFRGVLCSASHQIGIKVSAQLRISSQAHRLLEFVSFSPPNPSGLWANNSPRSSPIFPTSPSSTSLLFPPLSWADGKRHLKGCMWWCWVHLDNPGYSLYFKAKLINNFHYICRGHLLCNINWIPKDRGAWWTI